MQKVGFYSAAQSYLSVLAKWLSAQVSDSRMLIPDL
jgi:hypothetical protein